MMKSIRIIFLLFFILFLFANPAMAEVILYGTISEGGISADHYGANETQRVNGTLTFPMPKYRYHMYAEHLRYDPRTPAKRQMKDISDYVGEIEIDAELISSDKVNGIYKFKLTPRVTGLVYKGHDSLLWLVGGMVFDGSLMFADGSPAVFFIEVKLGYNKRGNPILINVGQDKHFKFDYISNRDPTPTLIGTMDFPVIMVDPNDVPKWPAAR